MGAGSKRDQAQVETLQKVLPCLAIDTDVWNLSYELAQICRAKGTPVPASDLIIAACAFFHQAHLEANDKHFTLLEGYR